MIIEEDENLFLKEQGLVINSEIAKGGYGVVYNVFSTVYNAPFALKKIPVDKFRICEVECFKQIDNPHIVALYRHFTYNNYVYLLMEYCPKDLSGLVEELSCTITSVERAKIIYDMILCIKACHDRKIAHCDVKPSNFLIDQYGRLKITDFGLSTITADECEKDPHEYKGTRFYMAPEIYKKEHYDKLAADIWALGVSIYHLFTKNYPFYDENTQLLVERMNRGLFPVDKFDDVNLIRLLGKCLQSNPQKRPTAAELLTLPYFQQFHMNSINLISNNLKVGFAKTQQDPIVKPKIPKVKSYMSITGRVPNLLRKNTMKLVLSNV